jgi:hypothetical protein
MGIKGGKRKINLECVLTFIAGVVVTAIVMRMLG